MDTSIRQHLLSFGLFAVVSAAIYFAYKDMRKMEAKLAATTTAVQERLQAFEDEFYARGGDKDSEAESEDDTDDDADDEVLETIAEADESGVDAAAESEPDTEGFKVHVIEEA